jgi:FixJ family two-component response regulator
MSTAVVSYQYSANQTRVLRSGFRPASLPDATPVVFVIHEDAFVREWLGTLMRSEGWRPETYASAQEFLARPRAVVPNCLVLDASLSEHSSLDLQKRLGSERPDMPIIFIAEQFDVTTTVKAMKGGAVEFLTKPFQDDLLLSSVREALEISRVARTHETELQLLRDRHALLTSRERQVMTLVASGLLNKQVGGELGISEITVKAHRGQVMQKMMANSLADLVKMAARLGLASLSICGLSAQRKN